MFKAIAFASILGILFGVNSFFSPLNFIEKIIRNDSEKEVVNSDPYLLPVSEANYYPIRDWNIPDPRLSARSAVIYDLNSDKVLFDRSPKEKLAIASLTKLMTAVVLIENVSLEDTVRVTKSAIEKSKKEGGGNDLYAGEKFKVVDLLKLMLIKSSNVATYSFEEHLREKYGLELVEKINEKAAMLEMLDTHFTEAAGLDDKNSFSTSQDLIKLVKYSLRYDLLFDILKTPATEVASIDGQIRHRILNTNQLLGILLNIIGGKTGFTELAGESMILVTRAPETDSKLILVVLGSNDRFEETKRLVEWAEKAYLWK